MPTVSKKTNSIQFYESATDEGKSIEFEYVNINNEETIEITIRGKNKPTINIKLDDDQVSEFEAFVQELNGNE